MSKKNQKGRSKTNDHHVRFYDWELRSDAFRSLSPYSRTLLLEFKRRYKGTNNGEIPMSLREAAELCNCSEKPMRKSFKQLEKLGFITVAQKGAFSVKLSKATRWYLTEYPIHNAIGVISVNPKKDFMSYKSASKEKSRRTHSRPTVYLQPQKDQSKSKIGGHGVPTVRHNDDKSTNTAYPEYAVYKLPCAKQEAKLSARPYEARQQAHDDFNHLGSSVHKILPDGPISIEGRSKANNSKQESKNE